jgi:arylsulfatase A-like enzyme
MAATTGPPNVVLICVDTLRADHSSAYGYPRNTTPGLRRLAEQGVLFETAYAPMAQTAPSMATIFTGNHPATHGLDRNGLPLEERSRTLAEIFREHGYQTTAIVGSFVLDARFGFRQGFDVYQDDFDAEGASVKPGSWEGERVPAGFDRRADATTRRAAKWLWVERDRERPFFLFLHYFDPHAPYEAPASFRPAFDGSEPTSARSEGTDVSKPLRLAIRDYDTEVAFTDREIARFLTALDGVGLAASTLVVATADHGEGLLDHGHWLHGLDVYEETMRVPLILRWTGTLPAGVRLSEPVALVDLAPTLLALVGLRSGEPSRRFDGISLVPAMKGRSALDPKRPILLYRRYFERGVVDGIPVSGDLLGVRRGDLKLIDGSDDGFDALYDLEQDPREQRNLLPQSAERAAPLRDYLTSWRDHLTSRRDAKGSGEPTRTLSEEERRALEALGYAEPEGKAP